MKRVDNYEALQNNMEQALNNKQSAETFIILSSYNCVHCTKRI